MSLVDINVTRTLTINTGNYESIKPSVSLTLKDVKPEDVADKYVLLESALTGLVGMEISQCNDILREIQESGIRTYCNNIDQHRDQIGGVIEQKFIELSK